MREFLSDNMVAIGWPGIGDLTQKCTREAIKEALLTCYQYSSRSLGQAAGQIFRFKEEMRKNDYVVVPDGPAVYVGTVKSDSYVYNGAVDSDDKGYPHQREVQWLYDKRAVPRNELTGRMFDSLKGQQAVFTTYFDDVDDLVKNKRYLFTKQSTVDLQNQYLGKLQAGLLRGVNSNTFEEAVQVLLNKYFPGIARQGKSSSPQGDTDLKAELPGDVTVRVQVKHFYTGPGALPDWVVDQLAASMEPGDNGIIVTAGSVSDDARSKADQLSDKRITFIDGPTFVDLLFASIDEMPDDKLAVLGLSWSTILL